MNLKKVMGDLKNRVKTNVEKVVQSLGETAIKYNLKREMEKEFLGMLRFSQGGLPVSQDRFEYTLKDIYYEFVESILSKKYLKE
ncbi:MAG: hypothetical protein ABH811_01115 [archaeon]